MSTENPFATPSNASDAAYPDGGLLPATQGKRFLTYIIDNIVMLVLNLGVGFLVGVVAAIVMVDPNDPSGGLSPEQLGFINLMGTVVGLFATFLYYVIFEAAFGKTIGKMVCGTKVVNESGGPPSFGQVLGRSACRFIPFEFVSFFTGNSKNPVGWHDSIPKTRVIQG